MAFGNRGGALVEIALHHHRRECGDGQPAQLVQVDVAPLGALGVAQAGIAEGCAAAAVQLADPPVTASGEVVEHDRLTGERHAVGGIQGRDLGQLFRRREEVVAAECPVRFDRACPDRLQQGGDFFAGPVGHRGARAMARHPVVVTDMLVTSCT